MINNAAQYILSCLASISFIVCKTNPAAYCARLQYQYPPTPFPPPTRKTRRVSTLWQSHTGDILLELWILPSVLRAVCLQSIAISMIPPSPWIFGVVTFLHHLQNCLFTSKPDSARNLWRRLKTYPSPVSESAVMPLYPLRHDGCRCHPYDWRTWSRRRITDNLEWPEDSLKF